MAAGKPHFYVKVEGLDEIRERIGRIENRETKQMLAGAYKDGLEIIADRARELAPRRSGDLAGSIRTVGGTQKTGRVFAGSAKVPYAGPIHWGWPRRNIEPQPFLSEAVGDTLPQVRDIFGGRMREILDQIDRGVF